MVRDEFKNWAGVGAGLPQVRQFSGPLETRRLFQVSSRHKASSTSAVQHRAGPAFSEYCLVGRAVRIFHHLSCLLGVGLNGQKTLIPGRRRKPGAGVEARPVWRFQNQMVRAALLPAQCCPADKAHAAFGAVRRWVVARSSRRSPFSIRRSEGRTFPARCFGLEWKAVH